MRQLEFAQVPIEEWVFDPMNMASLMVLVMLCISLPTLVKLSTLMQCPEVLLSIDVVGGLEMFFKPVPKGPY